MTPILFGHYFYSHRKLASFQPHIRCLIKNPLCLCWNISTDFYTFFAHIYYEKFAPGDIKLIHLTRLV